MKLNLKQLHWGRIILLLPSHRCNTHSQQTKCILYIYCSLVQIRFLVNIFFSPVTMYYGEDKQEIFMLKNLYVTSWSLSFWFQIILNTGKIFLYALHLYVTCFYFEVQLNVIKIPKNKNNQSHVRNGCSLCEPEMNFGSCLSFGQHSCG